MLGGTSSASGRLGHRKSSLALTPEEEPLDTTSTTPVSLSFLYLENISGY